MARSDEARQMRPADIDDKFWSKIETEYKKRKGINVNYDATKILLDILTDWLKEPVKEAAQ